MTLDEFLEKVCLRPLPTNPMTQVRILAKELAEGASLGVMGTSLLLYRDSIRDKIELHDDSLKQYMNARWSTLSTAEGMQNGLSSKELMRLVSLLIAKGFLLEPASPTGLKYELHPSCFDLLDEAEISTVFISYKRDSSSAFALLVLRYLKQFGVEAFLDLAIEPGSDWHASLEDKIEYCEFMVLLLGKTTLSSENVCKEIMWALEKRKVIIPIRQPDFSFCNIVWPENLSQETKGIISRKVNLTNAIRVQEESALEYHKAITELLNRFGITP